MYNKRGVVSITTFSLVILLAFSIYLFSSWYYYSYKTDYVVEIKKEELLNSVSTYRSDMLNLVLNQGSNLTYENNLDSLETTIYLDNMTITGKQVYNNDYIVVNISTLGFQFCSNYSFYPRVATVFEYDGTCVSKVS